MSTVTETHAQRLEFLRTQYQVVESKWRFFQGLRYGALVFWGGLQVTILGFYQATQADLLRYQAELAASKSPLIPPTHGLSMLALLVLLAEMMLIVATLLDRRLRRNFNARSQKGRFIEREFMDLGGIFTTMATTPTRLALTTVYRVLFSLVFTAWIALGIRTYYLLTLGSLPYVW